MKTAELPEIWRELRLSPPLPRRGFRMRQYGTSSHTRCYAAVADPDGQLAFIIEIAGDESNVRLPPFSTRAFSVSHEHVPGIAGGSSALILALHDSALSDLFALLCADLEAAVRKSSAASAVRRDAVMTIERWRDFLQRRSALLTREEIRGLIGELVTLARLITLIGADAAVTAWRGPLRGIRDFESELLYAETKTFTPSAGASVYISDPLQLEAPPGRRLKLVCIAVDQSPSGSTLFQYVLAVESLLQGDSNTLNLFRQRVAAAGFLPSMDEALPDKFVAFEPRVFEVRDGFPRILPATIPSGVRSVRFAVELAALSGFATQTDAAIGSRSSLLSSSPLP
jgi:hypothetical protein